MSDVTARRKLPTPPSVEPASSPVNTSRQQRVSDVDVDIDSPGRQRGSVTITDDHQGGSFQVSFDAPQRGAGPAESMRETDRSKAKVDNLFAVTSTPKRRVRTKPTAPSLTRAHTVHNDDEQHLSLTDYKLSDLVIDTPRHHETGADAQDTARSIDTQVLLQDTDQVMKVLGHREQHKQKSHTSSKTAGQFDVFDFNAFKQKEDLKLALSDDELSDTSSTCALVDEQLTAVSSAGASRLSVNDAATRHKRRGAHSGDYLTPSDGFESEESGSVASNSTDYSHGRRTSSPGQLGRKLAATDKTSTGRISNTRTNRAFALRRSRTETEDVDIPKSAQSGADAATRSGAKLAAAKDSARTDVSLGAKIVQKSRENQGQSGVKRSETFTRKDGGRFSLRAQKAGPLLNVSKITANAKPTSDLSRPRAGRQASVKGSSSRSTGGSSVSSGGGGGALTGKRAEEHDAWKRRSKYDPRKAIAEAKAREQEERRQSRARSADNTPELSDRGRSDADTADDDDSFALGAESSNLSGVTDDMDEITRLSSAVASDLNLLTESAQHEQSDQSQVSARRELSPCVPISVE